MSIDQHIVLWFYGLTGKWAALDWLASHLANDYLVPVLMTSIGFALWFHGNSSSARRRNQMGLFMGGLSLGIAAAIVSVIDAFYFRPRPYVALPQLLPVAQRLFYLPTVSSFPSFPAAVGYAFAFGIGLRHRAAGVVIGFLVTLWCLARIYVGVHYLSDILGGAAIAVFATVVALLAVKLGRPLLDRGFKLLELLYLA